MLDFDPDVFVSCGETNPDGHSRNDPVMAAEVLSPSTQRNDRGDNSIPCRATVHRERKHPHR